MGYPFSEFRHVPKVLQMSMNDQMGDMEFAGQFCNSFHWIYLPRYSQGIVVQLHSLPSRDLSVRLVSPDRNLWNHLWHFRTSTAP